MRDLDRRREGVRRESGPNQAPHIDPRRPGASSAGLPAPNRRTTWDRGNHGDPNLHPRHRPSFHTVWMVKDYIRERERRGREMFVPLTHPPGHAQADFGEATVIIGGVEQKAHFFAFDLPHSDACYIMAYPAATSEAWVDGHVHAFAFFGRVPVSVLYDNDRCLVASILPDGTRKRAKLFSGFLSHYLIRDRYGRPGKGNDKGGVEGLVGYARRNFMVPPLMHVNMHCRAVGAAVPVVGRVQPLSRRAMPQATGGDFARSR